MELQKAVRKPFEVEQIQVTTENIEEVAAWCSGDIRIQTGVEGDEEFEEQYIKVRVHSPQSERQTKAYVGDHVLKSGSRFKVYTHKAYQRSFEKAKTAGYNEEIVESNQAALDADDALGPIQASNVFEEVSGLNTDGTFHQAGTNPGGTTTV